MGILNRILRGRQKHLTFRGIEIDGSISIFKTKMQELGYSEVYEDEETGSMVFEGIFSGREGCNISVIYSKKIEKVYRVEVYFPAENNSEILQKDYLLYKQHLSEKYGEPSVSYEMNRPEYKFEEIDLIQGIRENKSIYCSVYESPLGHIVVQIVNKMSGVRLKIGYEDLCNQKLYEMSKKEVFGDL